MTFINGTLHILSRKSILESLRYDLLEFLFADKRNFFTGRPSGFHLFLK